MERIEIYKQMAALILSRQYHLEEMPAVTPILNYLKQEIEKNEPAEAANDIGAQG